MNKSKNYKVKPLFIQEYDNITIIVSAIDQAIIGEAQDLLFSPEEQQYYSSLIANARKAEWLTVRKILRNYLNTEFLIKYKESGKPYFYTGNFNISISHSKSHAAVILVKEGFRAGIDIEQISSRVTNVSRKFISENEMSFAEKGDLSWMTLIWCIKEVIYKIHFEGNIDFLKDIEVRPFVLNKDGGKAQVLLKSSVKNEHFDINYFILENNVVAWSVKEI